MVVAFAVFADVNRTGSIAGKLNALLCRRCVFRCDQKQHRHLRVAVCLVTFAELGHLEVVYSGLPFGQAGREIARTETVGVRSLVFVAYQAVARVDVSFCGRLGSGYLLHFGRGLAVGQEICAVVGIKVAKHRYVFIFVRIGGIIPPHRLQIHVAESVKQQFAVDIFARNGHYVIGKVGGKLIIGHQHSRIAIDCHLRRVSEAHFLELGVGNLVNTGGLHPDFHPFSAAELRGSLRLNGERAYPYGGHNAYRSFTQCRIYHVWFHSDIP